MPTKQVDEYQIEYTSAPLAGTEFWGAYVAIFGASDNPLHLTEIYPKQRVAADEDFSSAEQAEAGAERAGQEVLEQLRTPPGAAAP